MSSIEYKQTQLQLQSPSFLSSVPSEARQYFGITVDSHTPIPLRTLDRAGYYQSCIVPAARSQSLGMRREVAAVALNRVARDGEVLDLRYGRYKEHARMMQANYRSINQDGMYTLLSVRAWQHRLTEEDTFQARSFDQCYDHATGSQPGELQSASVAYLDVYMDASGYPDAPTAVRQEPNKDIRARIMLGTNAITAQVYYPEFTGSINVGITEQRAAELGAFISYADGAA